MSKFFRNLGPVSVVFSIVLSVLFVVNVVQAATTIGNNISTDGTVNVTGLSSLGQASTTNFSNIGMAYFGGTATTTIDSAGNVNAQGITVGSTTIDSIGNVNAQTISIGGGDTILKHLSTVGYITFGTVAANACNTGTITITGAADGDSVDIGMPNIVASASSTLVWSGWVSAANTVTVRLCQTAAQGTSPVPFAGIRADVWQHSNPV